MCSSFPVRAPKSQPAVEQQLKGRHWNPPKKISPIQEQRRSHNKTIGGAQLQLNQILYPLCGWLTNWKTTIPKKFSQCCEGSRPHISSPAQESGRGTWNCQGIWLWRPVGIDYRASMVLGETEILGRHKQNLMCTRTQGKEPVTPQEMEPELPVSIWGSPAEVWVVSSLPWGQVYWQQQSWEIQVLA